jgi:cyclophilin family peptidyl-prolyl cis-trans isomerase
LIIVFVRTGLVLLLAIINGAALFSQPTQPAEVSLLNPADPAFAAPAPHRFFVRLQTNEGPVLLDVQRALAPQGVDRFHALVKHGFYDQARFFRVVAPRFVQFGIPADPAVAQAWRERTIPDDERRASNLRGSMAFAYAVKNGRTTQVFINLRDNSADFDKEFAPFAHVIDGMDIVDRLYSDYAETSGGGIRAGKQDPLFTGGSAFLAKAFPELDYIISATVLFADP